MLCYIYFLLFFVLLTWSDMKSWWSKGVCMQPCGWNNRKASTHKQRRRKTIRIKILDIRHILIQSPAHILDFGVMWIHVSAMEKQPVTTQWHSSHVFHLLPVLSYSVFGCRGSSKQWVELAKVKSKLAAVAVAGCGQMFYSRSCGDCVTEIVSAKTSWMDWKCWCQRLLFRVRAAWGAFKRKTDGKCCVLAGALSC